MLRNHAKTNKKMQCEFFKKYKQKFRVFFFVQNKQKSAVYCNETQLRDVKSHKQMIYTLSPHPHTPDD